MCDLKKISGLLGKEQPGFAPGKEYASVAIVINDSRIIIERRASSLNDPWAGQFSLPGGHFKPDDKNLLNTVIREVKEETGLEIDKNSEYLGLFGPFSPMNRENLDVFVFVFAIHGKNVLIQSSETEMLKWEEMKILTERKGRDGGNITFRIEEGVIWGLTARILDSFLSLC
jgi:8-oxo-dGTP pyrophosphatase MutT (NUDIX family)